MIGRRGRHRLGRDRGGPTGLRDPRRVEAPLVEIAPPARQLGWVGPGVDHRRDPGRQQALQRRRREPGQRTGASIRPGIANLPRPSISVLPRGSAPPVGMTRSMRVPRTTMSRAGSTRPASTSTTADVADDNLGGGFWTYRYIVLHHVDARRRRPARGQEGQRRARDPGAARRHAAPRLRAGGAHREPSRRARSATTSRRSTRRSTSSKPGAGFQGRWVERPASGGGATIA